MSSWKTYGGINRFENSGQINADSLNVNYLSMKQAFRGNFDICGQLTVYGNVNIQDSLMVENDVGLYGNVIIGDPGSIHTLTVYSDSIFEGDVTLNKDFNVDGSIIVEGSLRSKNDVIVGRVLDFSGQSFLYSSGNSLGLNTMTPNSAFDISTSLINAISVHSYNNINENILAQNASGKGVILGAGTSSTYIHLYNDHTISSGLVDASIYLAPDGYLNIDVSKNVNISAPTTIGTADNFLHPYNEILTVYDVSQSVFFGNIYQNNSAYTGAAASFIADSNGSNTFIYIGTPSNGGAIGGGVYAGDMNRSMTTIGLTDTSGSYIPSQMIVSGISSLYYTTTGINTFKPRTDQYVLDINGPIHIDNGDIREVVTTPPFELYSVSSMQGVIVALGSSIDVLSDIEPIFPPIKPRQSLITSSDNGFSWRYKDIFPFNDVLKGDVLTGISAYDTNNIFITGSVNTLLNSINSGTTWRNLSTGISGNPTLNNICINRTGTTISGNVVGYFSFDSSMVIFESPTIPGPFTFNKQIIPTPIDIISSIGANSSTIYLCGNSIVKYTTSSLKVQPPVLTWNRSYSSYFYNEINVFDNSFAIAVGGNIISSTIDGGSTWYDNSFNTRYGGLGVDFKSIYISDISNAVAVGSKGNIWVTSNKGISWSPIFKNLINPSGKADWLLNTTNNFRNVTMTDLNTIMITNTITPYNYYGNIYGNSQIFSIFSPNFINRKNNIVFDVSGSSRFSGDLQINDNGSILSNSSSFKLLNSDVQTICFGGGAASIVIGASTGNTVINSVTRMVNTSTSINPTTGALIVSGGVGVAGNLNIGGFSKFISDTSFNGNIGVSGVSYFSNIPSTSISSGSVVVAGGIGVAGNIHLGGNINVGGNVIISRGLSILGNNVMSGNVSVTSITPSTSYSSGAFIVSGGAGIGGNLNVRGFSNFTSDASFNGNIRVTSITPSLNVTSGSLIVSGGVGIGGALNVNNNSTFNNNLTAENLYSNGNIILNGGLYYNGNNPNFVIAPTDSVSGVVDIRIGRPTDKITIIGTLVATTRTETSTNNPAIIVNKNTGNAISYTAGIDIYDNSGVSVPGHINEGENVWAYMRVGQDLQSFVFKTPSFGRVGGPTQDASTNIVQLSPENRVRFSINELNLRDISNNIRRGLVMIQPDLDFQAYQTSKGHFYNGSSPYGDADYSINICPDFDISNILLKNFDTISGVQTIGTQLAIRNTFSVYGNTNLYGNTFVYGNTSVYGNIVVGNSILGNAIFTNISGNVGIGRNNPTLLLDVSGSSRFIGSLVNTNYDLSTFNSTYGSSWSERNIAIDLSSSIQDITMSYDGQYQYALMYDKFGFGSVKKSLDFGSSWSVKKLPNSYSGNIIYQAVPYLTSNVSTFMFQDLTGNITLPNATPLNIQIGTYTASASSVGSPQFPFYVFDSSVITFWQSVGDGYNNSGDYIGSVSTNGVLGEYVQISLPYSFCLKNYQIYPQNPDFNNNHPKSIYTFGSNDTIRWNQLSSNTILPNTSGNTFVSFQNSISYNSYRFVINTLQIGGTSGKPVTISRMDLSGIFQNTTGSFSSSIASSSDGKYITVANQGYYNGTGNLYTSSDFGITYNDSNKRSDAVWQNVAMSQRGNIQAAVGINRSGVGNILISSDYGSTWANIFSRPNGWQTISISSTGQFITAIQSGNVSSPKGNIWISSNYGASWSSNTQIYNYVQTVNGFLNLGADDFNKTVCVSSSGQYQTTLGLAPFRNTNGVNGNANIWISSNYGVNWSDTLTRAPTLNGHYSILSSVSMNNSGQYQIASFIGGNTGLGVPTNNVFGGVLTSTDYGQSWMDTAFRLPSKTVSGNTYYGYFQKIISSYTGVFNMAMPKYQDISGNSYNNTNNTVVGIDNVFSSSYNTSGNIFSTQYLGSSHTGNVLQTHGLQVTVPILNNESLMMGYDIFYNSAYINSADNTSVNPIGLNTTGGFVGVGTIQPSYTLDVSGTTNISGNLFVTNDVSFNSALNVGNLNVGKNILVSGNVGIGTNNPLTLLSTGSLVNNIKISVFDNGSGTNLYGLGYNPSGYMTFCSGQIQSDIPQMVLTNGGSLGIGTTAPEYTLDISGTVRSTQQITALSFNSTSDYRFKTNIHNIYRTVDHLKPIEYDFIGGSHDMGFLAHEVQKIFPFLVSGKKDGKEKQSINYNGFIALLVKEVQDLKYENNSLKERMDILEARLS